MEVTLKDYLAEVDRWKEAAARRLEGLSPSERTTRAQEAKAWLEAKLGRPAQAAAPPPPRLKASS